MIKYIINFERLCKAIPMWKWVELKIGLEKSIISNQDVKTYAIQMLTESVDKYDLVLELSIADENEVREILENLCFLEEQREEEIINKWIFAIIYYAYTYDRDKVFEIIEEIYVEFEYSRLIQHLISYMPCEDGKTREKRLEEFICNGVKNYSD